MPIAEEPARLDEIHYVPVRACERTDHDRSQPPRPRGPRLRGESDSAEDGERRNGRHLRSDRECRRQNGQDKCPPCARDQEDRSREEWRRHDEVVQGGGRLQQDDRERREDEGAERCLLSVEAEMPGESEDRDRADEPGAELNECREAFVARQLEDERHGELGMRRVRIQALVVRVVDVADTTFLPPERGSRKVVDEGVDRVGRRSEGQRQHVGVGEPRNDRDRAESRGRARPERGNRRSRTAGARPDAERDRAHRQGREEQHRAPHAAERREDEHERDDLREDDDISGEDQLGRRAQSEGGGEGQPRDGEGQCDDDDDRDAHHARRSIPRRDAGGDLGSDVEARAMTVDRRCVNIRCRPGVATRIPATSTSRQ